MAQFKEILQNRDFLFLWLGQIISQFGDRLNQMALIALISVRAPGSTFQLAKIFSCTLIPVFLVGPLAYSYVDRWNRRRTMIICDLLRSVLVVCVALFFVNSENLVPIYIIIFLVFSVSRFFVPAKMALIPELVSKDKLLLANSLSSTTGMIAAVAGFGLGGLIVERVGSCGGFFIDSLTYIISAIFILMIAAGVASAVKKDYLPGVKDIEQIFKKTLFEDIKEGWQYVAANKDIRFVGRTFFLLWSALGAVYVIIIVFVQKTLGSVTQDLGILAMCLGLGLFCGTLSFGRWGHKLSKVKVIFLSLGTAGVVLSLFALGLRMFSSIALAAALSFVLGLTISPIMISANTLIHEAAKEKMHGRIFGSLEIVAHFAFLVFMFLSAWLAEQVGRFWILMSVGMILALIGFGACYLRIDQRRTA